MDKKDKILDSFSIRKELNPKIWDTSGEIPKMNPKVRNALLKISEEFIDYLGDDVFVDDVILTGSLSNYNWSEYSDFDLHVTIDFNQYGKRTELYKELFNLKKQVFNDKHNIKIFDYDVELYAQDSEESYYSSGVYSVMNDEWVSEPKKIKFKLDKELLTNKINCWVEKIDSAIKSSEEEKNNKSLEKLKNKLKTYRQSGLKKGGELSYENLVFKYLRRSEHIKNLMDASNKITDKKLSVERKIEESSSSSPEFLGGSNVKIPGDGAHRGQSGWQSANAWDIKASIGTPVYSLTNGRLRTFSDYGPRVIKKSNKKLFGQSFTVQGDQGFPNVYYTHLKNATVSKGSQVKCGQLLGYIMDFPNSSYDHVHLGVEPPGHIKNLINPDGTIKCASGVSAGGYSQDSYSDTTTTGDISLDLRNLITDKVTLNAGQTSYNKNVEIIQTALQQIGFDLPKYGVDGKFGNETKEAIKQFQRDSGLDITGNITEEDLWYLLAGVMYGTI